MARDLRSITMASPKLFAMNATRWLSGEISARSPKCVRTSMFEGKCCRGSSGDLWPRGSIKQEDRMTTKVRTGRSYHPRHNWCCGGHYDTQAGTETSLGLIRVSLLSEFSSGHPRRRTYSNHAPANCDVSTAARTRVV